MLWTTVQYDNKPFCMTGLLKTRKQMEAVSRKVGDQSPAGAAECFVKWGAECPCVSSCNLGVLGHAPPPPPLEKFWKMSPSNGWKCIRNVENVTFLLAFHLLEWVCLYRKSKVWTKLPPLLKPLPLRGPWHEDQSSESSGDETDKAVCHQGVTELRTTNTWLMDLSCEVLSLYVPSDIQWETNSYFLLQSNRFNIVPVSRFWYLACWINVVFIIKSLSISNFLNCSEPFLRWTRM